MRLVDFQIVGPAVGLRREIPINEALFAVYEPVRLILRERRQTAPFRKIVVSLAASGPGPRVTVSLGICEATQVVGSELGPRDEHAREPRWVLGWVERALRSVEDQTGWRSDDLRALIGTLAKSGLPFLHRFDRLARVDRSSGRRCVPWMSFRPGETRLGVQIGDRNVVVRSHSGPLFLEDDFPLARTAMVERDFVMLDRARRVLARIPIDEPAAS